MKSPRFIVALGLAVTLALGQPAWADAPATLPRGIAAGPSIEGISEYTLPNGNTMKVTLVSAEPYHA